MGSTTIPNSFYEAKRKFRDLGLGYETIHACMVVYCIGKSLLICNIILHVARLGTRSADMRWHRDKYVEIDDVLRHLADAKGWKYFDSKFPDFASDPRNVRLGLASDGFNIFGQMSTSSPDREIDVYLQLLIEELKELWTFGVRTYDSLTVRTLLNIKGKTKDTTNARLDLQDLKIRKDLHLVEVGNRLVKPHANYMLTSSERVEFCKFMKSVKLSD
ncbi:uncharacterized protein E5676_scaffold2119G00380 [Cucumis melo var. makuwa]|uniref:Uncharacterized protein n=1 Tax=Cucumis melo var. makuwa TaxID=1194695 RepID=A0A5D3BYA7_CUCMM|nr:uncharacterized protein E6C27_scaffold979G00890 [Cucumis melo var. makuwa]TYK04100.1 uncharacterized protein E5676_scaffold2119G00380 [Cucumis melo var. makuwa]